MKICSIVGWSNSGKTTLICGLIELLKQKGYKVAVLKNIAKEYHLQPQGKDSSLFLGSGADEVFLNSKTEFLSMCYKQKDLEEILEERKIAQAYDFLISEGYLFKDSIVIETLGSGNQIESLKYPLDKIDLVLSDSEIKGTIPNLRRDDFENIIKILEGYNG